MYIAPRREVLAEVAAAALLAPERCARHQTRHGQQVEPAPGIRLERVVLGHPGRARTSRDRRRRTAGVLGSERGPPIATSSHGCLRCPARARWRAPRPPAPAATRDRALARPRGASRSSPTRRAPRRPGLRATSCWPGGWRRERLCRRSRPRHRGQATMFVPTRRYRCRPSCSARPDRPEWDRWRCRSRPGRTSPRSSETGGGHARHPGGPESRNTCPPVSSVSRTMLRATTSRGARSPSAW